MRSQRGNAKLFVVAMATLAGLAVGPMAEAAPQATPTSAKADVRGVIVRFGDGIDGGMQGTSLQLPGMRFLPVRGADVDRIPSGSHVVAKVDVPQPVVDAARADDDAPAEDGQVHLSQGQLAQASQVGSAPVGSPLARATVASATSTGTSLTASRVTVVVPPPSGVQAGTQEITVAIVRPSDVRAAPATAAQIRAQVAAASTYWSEESGGRIRLAATTISAPYTSQYPCGAKMNLVWREAAERTGFTEAANKHLLLAFPKGSAGPGSACPYGLASIGSSVNSGGVAQVSDTAWPVLAHEIGHNFGLGHSQALQCTRSDADLPNLPAGCRINEYGYPWSVMAKSATDRAGALSTVQATRIGLLSAPDIVDVTAGSRTVNLNAVSTLRGLRSLRVTDPKSGEAYYVEYRTRTGRDRLLYDNVPNGVRILKVDTTQWDSRGSVVLDMTPTGRDSDNVRQLDAGKSFTSRTGGVTIRVNSAGTTASVTASIGAAAAKPRPAAPRQTARAEAVAARVAVPTVNAVSATDASARIAWAGAAAGGRYDVQTRVVGADRAGRATYGPATTWLAGTARTSAVFTGTYGGVYQVSARLRTAAGTSAWSPWQSTTFAVDAGSGASLSGRWQTVRNRAYYAGTVAATSTNGAALQRPATAATNIKVVGTRHAHGSVARVYVDGRLRTTVNTYAARTANRQVLANISVPAGRHVVRVVNLATGARPTLLLDAVAYSR